MTDTNVRHEVYITNRVALITYATRILGSKEAAEDIVQDAFIRFLPANTQDGSPTQLLSYLYKVVRNLAFDVLKRQKLQIRETAQEPPFWSIPAKVATPEELTSVSDELKQIMLALEDLPISCRIALEMHRFGGYTLEEIAEHLDISVATAHRHVRSAMVRIASVLAEDVG